MFGVYEHGKKEEPDGLSFVGFANSAYTAVPAGRGQCLIKHRSLRSLERADPTFYDIGQASFLKNLEDPAPGGSSVWGGLAPPKGVPSMCVQYLPPLPMP